MRTVGPAQAIDITGKYSKTVPCLTIKGPFLASKSEFLVVVQGGVKAQLLFDKADQGASVSNIRAYSALTRISPDRPRFLLH